LAKQFEIWKNLLKHICQKDCKWHQNLIEKKQSTFVQHFSSKIIQLKELFKTVFGQAVDSYLFLDKNLAFIIHLLQ
jgi:hypothetical protein